MTEFFKLMFWATYIRGENPISGMFRVLVVYSFIPILASLLFCWIMEVNFFVFWGAVFRITWEHIVAFFGCVFDSECMGSWKKFFQQAFF